MKEVKTVPSLSALFENLLFKSGEQSFSKERVITVIGSGGKTSLIWRLASGLAGCAAALLAPGRKVLVTPTTKMFVPPPETKVYKRYYGLGGPVPAPEPGVTLAGVFNEASGKLESFQLDKLENIIKGYDLVLIEGDGSKGLPYKAWKEDEPVVPSFTDLTIGVLPIKGLGEQVSEKTVHRLPLFTELTGASLGGMIKTEHLRRLITGTGEDSLSGLFAKAHGKKLLFFNQAEGEASLKQASELADSLPQSFRKSLCGIIAGSVKEDRVIEL